MGSFSIENPIENVLLIPVCIAFPIETPLTTGWGSKYLQTLKFHNFVMNTYFLGWSKKKIPQIEKFGQARCAKVFSKMCN